MMAEEVVLQWDTGKFKTVTESNVPKNFAPDF